MSATICDNCGAQLLAEARFCRQCGKPQTSLATDEARAEAPTQTLGAREAAAPTERWKSSPTSPAYLAPQSAPPPETAPVPQYLQPPSKKGRFSLLLLATVFLLLLTSLLAVGFVVDRVLRRPTVIVKHTGKPEAPSVPSAPSAPNNGGNIAIDQSLIYPGAQTTLNVIDDDNKVVQLHTSDSSDKVIDWYTAKLKPKNIVRQESMPAVLTNDDTSVVITPQGNGTDILITKENK